MRAKFLATIMQAVFLGMGLLVLVPPINPTAVGETEQPSLKVRSSARPTRLQN